MKGKLKLTDFGKWRGVAKAGQREDAFVCSVNAPRICWGPEPIIGPATRRPLFPINLFKRLGVRSLFKRNVTGTNLEARRVLQWEFANRVAVRQPVTAASQTSVFSCRLAFRPINLVLVCQDPRPSHRILRKTGAKERPFLCFFPHWPGGPKLVATRRCRDLRSGLRRPPPHCVSARFFALCPWRLPA